MAGFVEAEIMLNGISYNNMRTDLKKKIDRAIRLLKSIPTDKEPVELAYSGGKDSDVVLELAKMAGINYRAIYRNTTIDPPGTIKHVQDNGVEIVKPRYSFLQVLERKGLPSRYVRFCCSELKEYKIMDRCIMGIRREESHKRAENYKEPTECRLYKHSGQVVDAIYPILDWTLTDITEFIKERGIKCAPIYYDSNGAFHPERRLGCMCCPLASRKHRIAEFKQHPNMVKLYIRGGGKWLDSHPHAKNNPCQSDIYRLFARTLFYDTNAEFMAATYTLFDVLDWKSAIERYFNIKL